MEVFPRKIHRGWDKKAWKFFQISQKFTMDEPRKHGSFSTENTPWMSRESMEVFPNFTKVHDGWAERPWKFFQISQRYTMDEANTYRMPQESFQTRVSFSQFEKRVEHVAVKELDGIDVGERDRLLGGVVGEDDVLHRGHKVRHERDRAPVHGQLSLGRKQKNPINQSINQTIDQSINQSINRTINQSLKRPIFTPFHYFLCLKM